ncbi:hypothetical protein BHM03_00060806, partial [Ensete ventricosum]
MAESSARLGPNPWFRGLRCSGSPDRLEVDFRFVCFHNQDFVSRLEFGLLHFLDYCLRICSRLTFKSRSNLYKVSCLQGLLDEQFEQLQMLQDESSPGFIAELITLFCGDSERILAELTKLLCLGALNVVKHEYYLLRGKFDTMLQVDFFLFDLKCYGN